MHWLAGKMPLHRFSHLPTFSLWGYSHIMHKKQLSTAVRMIQQMAEIQINPFAVFALHANPWFSMTCTCWNEPKCVSGFCTPSFKPIILIWLVLKLTRPGYLWIALQATRRILCHTLQLWSIYITSIWQQSYRAGSHNYFVVFISWGVMWNWIFCYDKLLSQIYLHIKICFFLG